jgi:hypothetical protein
MYAGFIAILRTIPRSHALPCGDNTARYSPLARTLRYEVMVLSLLAPGGPSHCFVWRRNMAVLKVDPANLANIRFALSPLTETVAALQFLATGGNGGPPATMRYTLAFFVMAYLVPF